MTSEELINRIRKELKLPHFQVYLDEKKYYSEEEYQVFKNDLLAYYENYVGNVEGYFPGLDSIEKNSTPDEF